MAKTFRDAVGGHKSRYLEIGDGIVVNGILGHRFAKRRKSKARRQNMRRIVNEELTMVQDIADEMAALDELLRQEDEEIVAMEHAEYLAELEAEERYHRMMDDELDSLYDETPFYYEYDY